MQKKDKKKENNLYQHMAPTRLAEHVTAATVTVLVHCTSARCVVS